MMTTTEMMTDECLHNRECFICCSSLHGAPLHPSPCACRGSLGWVHARCLYAAREAAGWPLVCPACRSPYASAQRLRGDRDGYAGGRAYAHVVCTLVAALFSIWAAVGLESVAGMFALSAAQLLWDLPPH